MNKNHFPSQCEVFDEILSKLNLISAPQKEMQANINLIIAYALTLGGLANLCIGFFI